MQVIVLELGAVAVTVGMVATVILTVHAAVVGFNFIRGLIKKV
jgi:hypothetical protein